MVLYLNFLSWLWPKVGEDNMMLTPTCTTQAHTIMSFFFSLFVNTSRNEFTVVNYRYYGFIHHEKYLLFNLLINNIVLCNHCC